MTRQSLFLCAAALWVGCSFPTSEFHAREGTPDVPVTDSPAIDAPGLDAAPDAQVVDGAPDAPGVDGAPDAPTADVTPDTPAPTDGPAPDVTACGDAGACAIGSACCGGRCIDVQSDGANCGACGVACGAGQSCCAGACVGTAGDARNCGRCGNVCDLANATASCASGVCAIQACAAGAGDCDGVVATGCESDLQSDPTHCGTCAQRCSAGANAGAVCNRGACETVCESGFADCDTTPSNGCEVRLATSTDHCGACGHRCTAGPNATPVCTAGACDVTCATGFADCDGDPTNGCEVNIATSLAHCGGCGLACAFTNATAQCTGSACVRRSCNAGYDDCDGNASNGCELPVLSDPANCGACGRRCATGQVCSGGACTSTCAAGTALCSGACVDTATSTAHCGACGRACPAPTNGAAACAASTCGLGACNVNFGNCDGNAANGCEANLATDPRNCGGCGEVCSTANGTASCVAGQCRIACAAGFADCNMDPDDGCEASLASVTSCGMCARTCPTPPAGSPVCTAGTCGLGTCDRGFGNCDRDATNGCEADLSSNNSHCGACGSACPRGTACSRGVCSSTCASGLTLCSGACVNLQTSASNCGACGRACGLLLTCIGGACVFPPPANDRCANATDIALSSGSRISLSATTIGANHDLDAPCSGVGGGDVFFRFTLTRREFIYADTLTAGFDTKLFFATSCTAALTRTAATGELLCDDNRGLSCTMGGTGSQVFGIFPAGTYYLVLSSQTSTNGSATIRFEHLPAGNGAVTAINAGSTIPSGTLAGTGSYAGLTCGGSGPENTYWWVSCPEYAGGSFSASTCLRTSTDTVLTVLNGSGAGNACNNNGPTTPINCGVASTVSATIPTGSGVHALYVDGFSGATGPYSVAISRP